MIAVYVARHWKPLPAGAPPTTAVYYKGLIPESLPRLAPPPDAVFSMPKGESYVLGRVKSVSVVPK